MSDFNFQNSEHNFDESYINTGKKSKRDYESDFIRTLPSEFRPMSSWGQFGFSLLFMFPILGFILAIVLGICARNINLRRFARFFIILEVFLFLIALIICALAYFFYFKTMMGVSMVIG